jgi:hypothetical protein
MRENFDSPQVPGSRDEPHFTRRELLKSLAALGGAVTASSLLPEKWSRPQVGAGALPAHAQSTLCVPPYEIDHCTIDIIQNSGTELTSSAWILPPCPGIEMIVFLYWIIELEAQPVKKAQSIPVVSTDATGKATWSMTVIDVPQGAVQVYVEWNFFDPADGSDSCQTEKVDVGDGAI